LLGLADSVLIGSPYVGKERRRANYASTSFNAAAGLDATGSSAKHQ
jgi:hypothetical protein